MNTEKLIGAHINNYRLRQSGLVTIIAWITIVVSGFSTVVSLVQNIMIHLLFSESQLADIVDSPVMNQENPSLTELMFGHYQLFFLAFFILSIATLSIAIGLLKRKNWARITFIGMMFMGILWNITCLYIQHAAFASMPPMPVSAPAGFRTDFTSLATIMIIFSTTLALGFSVLFAWIIRCLLSPEIQSEFIKNPNAIHAIERRYRPAHQGW